MKGQELYQEAKKLIPGSSNLYSKRAELYHANWPTYYKSARGAEITALDGQKFLDFSGAGVGACALGYADEAVDTAVRQAIARGSTSALLAPEEVELAQLLVGLHPWASMARFTRSGGEAIAVAIRIAQAKTGRVCVEHSGTSYHGWHVNNPITTDSYAPWTCSDCDSRQEIAAILIEPSRLNEPGPGYLEKVRKRATRIGAVLIFDEISCGFRQNLGGKHLHYGVNPDIAVFSKAMSNGYPMAAVIGTEKVMSAAQDTFISSTTWSERIGPTAALATIQKMKANNIFEHTKYIGELVKGTLEWEAKVSGILLTVQGPPQMLHLKFESPEVQTLYTQLMLERGILASKDFYPSYAHTLEHCERFSYVAKEIFPMLHDLTLLEGDKAEQGVQR